MEYPVLQERKEPWEPLGLAPGAQMGRKVHLGVLESPVHLVPVGLLVPGVLKETLVVLVLLDPLVHLVVLARMEFALMELKERRDFQDYEDSKVLRAAKVLQVLRVLVSKERREIKEHQVTRDHLVSVVNQDKKASRVKMDPQAHLDQKA